MTHVPRTLQSRLSCTRAPTSRTPGPTGHLADVTSPSAMLRGAPGQPSSSAPPEQTRAAEPSPAEAEERRWSRQTLLTPFRWHSLPRPSAPAGAGRTGHWGRNSRHQAGHVLASRACLVRRPGWPSHCSCQHGWAAAAPRSGHRPSPTEVPGLGAREDPVS